MSVRRGIRHGWLAAAVATIAMLLALVPGVPSLAATAIANTSPPTVSGTAQVGEVLTADTGTWDPSPEATTVQWLRDGTPIPGATGTTYLLLDGDRGTELSVAVTVSAAGYEDATATSAAVGPIAAAPTPTHCAGVVATIVGTPGPDRIVGTPGRDVIAALGGDDVVRAGAGDDLVCAGSGADEVSGAGGSDTLRGGNGPDLLKGGVGADELVGQRGADKLDGRSGRDVLRGNRGRDVLKGKRGADTLLGGKKRDRLVGGTGHDVLKGRGGNDELRGGKRPDRLFGNRGRDHLVGGAGHDHLRGGPGRDRIRPEGRPVAYPRAAPRPRWVAPNHRAVGQGPNARVTRLSDRVWRSMTGRSWHRGCPVGRARLRLVTVNYWDYGGHRRRGSIVVNSAIADRAAAALADMHRRGFPIRRMHRVDRFGWSSRLHGADDYASMRAGNTSAFNCRSVVGRPGVLSPHSYGRAIDVNPWENPYYSPRDGWVPDRWWVSRSHPRVAWRSTSHPVLRIWRSHGFRWTYGRGDAHHVDGRQVSGWGAGYFIAE